MQSVDAELLAAGSDVLSSQHGGVGGGLVTVSLDLHTTGDTGDGFATAVRRILSANIIQTHRCWIALVRFNDPSSRTDRMTQGFQGNGQAGTNLRSVT